MKRPLRLTDLKAALRQQADPPAPIPMILFCPNCGTQHVDKADDADPESFANPMRAAWTNPPHRSHLCEACDHVWRPADVCTVGVAEITTCGMTDDEPPIRRSAGPCRDDYQKPGSR